jgi:hypothetical protein
LPVVGAKDIHGSDPTILVAHSQLEIGQHCHSNKPTRTQLDLITSSKLSCGGGHMVGGRAQRASISRSRRDPILGNSADFLVRQKWHAASLWRPEWALEIEDIWRHEDCDKDYEANPIIAERRAPPSPPPQWSPTHLLRDPTLPSSCHRSACPNHPGLREPQSEDLLPNQPVQRRRALLQVAEKAEAN